MLTVSDVQALIVITLGDAFVLNRRVRQQPASQWCGGKHSQAQIDAAKAERGGFFSRIFGR